MCNFSPRESISQLRDLILEYLMNTDLLGREEEQYFLIRVLNFFFFFFRERHQFVVPLIYVFIS